MVKLFQVVSTLCLAATLAACQGRTSEFRFTVAIPGEIAAQASSRVAGNAQAPPPILVLQGVEDPLTEGMNITVLGEPQSGSKERPILATAGLVGSPNASSSGPSSKINVRIPLNAEAARLLAGKSEIALVLRVEGKNFKVDRVYFQDSH